MKTLGFIGMGNMAGAIAAGILQKGLMKKEEVFAYAPHYEKLEANAEKIGFVPCKDLKGLTAKADTLVISIPLEYNKPQILSRITTLNTKLKSLETFMNLEVIPQQKVAKLIPEINEEISGLYNQWNEIVIKKAIPKEIGEELMLQALDTTRNAKKIDFDELERKEKLKD